MSRANRRRRYRRRHARPVVRKVVRAVRAGLGNPCHACGAKRYWYRDCLSCGTCGADPSRPRETVEP